MAEGGTSRDKTRDYELRSDEISLLSRSAQKSGEILGAASVKLLGLPDNRMDSIDRLHVIKLVEKEVERLKPHTVVTHFSGDLNIDHRITNEAVMTACRPQPGHCVRRLLAFEVLSSTEWRPDGSNTMFCPNWFEDVSETIDRKIEALKIYETEMREWPHARSLKNAKNLAYLRGNSVGCSAAEAFILLRNIN
jgi:LmbE family N-acetylglucosaminyl deacetylase